jgi:hypothetical protein
MTRYDGFPRVVTSHTQLLLGFSSGAETIYDASETPRQLLRQAHSEVCKTPETPEQADVLERADNTPQFSPMRPRQLCVGRTSKGIVKRPNGVVRARHAASDVGRRVRVKWIPHYVKARNPPKSKMLWFPGTVIEHSTTANVRTHKVQYDDEDDVKWHNARGMQQDGLWEFLPNTSNLPV